MKAGVVVAGIAVLCAAALTGCPDRTVGGALDDALDNRPGEKVRDKVEDVQDKVKDATN